MCQAIAACFAGKNTTPGEWVPYLAALEESAREAEALDGEAIASRNMAILGALAEAMEAHHGPDG